MNRFTALILATLPFLFGCSSNAVYHPTSKSERIEYGRDILDVYPGDIRHYPDLYTNIGVGWAGIIKNTDVEEEEDGLIHVNTTFEHRYYDWEENRGLCRDHLDVSPRGEGVFRTDVLLRRVNFDTDFAPESYLSPGSLAIVYGVPQAVEDGVVILKYRYLRVIAPDHYKISRFDYGRFGEPVHYMDNAPGAPKS